MNLKKPNGKYKLDNNVGIPAAAWTLDVIFQCYVLKSRAPFRNKNRVIAIKKKQIIFLLAIKL